MLFKSELSKNIRIRCRSRHSHWISSRIWLTLLVQPSSATCVTTALPLCQIAPPERLQQPENREKQLAYLYKRVHSKCAGENNHHSWGRIQDFGQGALRSFDPRGGLSPKFAQHGVFSIKIAWKLHDFEKILGGGRPPGPPGSASDSTWFLERDSSPAPPVWTPNSRMVSSQEMLTFPQNFFTRHSTFLFLCQGSLAKTGGFWKMESQLVLSKANIDNGALSRVANFLPKMVNVPLFWGE